MRATSRRMGALFLLCEGAVICAQAWKEADVPFKTEPAAIAGAVLGDTPSSIQSILRNAIGVNAIRDGRGCGENAQSV